MPISVNNHRCVSASKPVATLVSNCTILQVEMLKQSMMMKRDKLKSECENSQVTEEVVVCTKEVEQLKEKLQFCDKEWQARLMAETNKWQARLEEHQQDVEAEQAKMAEAVAGITCFFFWETEIKDVLVYKVVHYYTSPTDSNICLNFVRKDRSEISPSVTLQIALSL